MVLFTARHHVGVAVCCRKFFLEPGTLADPIHDVGDAVTVIPLWFAFMLAQRTPTKMFTRALGRIEGLAGIVIVFIILFSALFAGYVANQRRINPQPITAIGWVMLTGFIGFAGNEIVEVFRIKVGQNINGAAPTAGGYHAHTDGFISLAGGARRNRRLAWLADPLMGLLITRGWHR